MAECLRHRVAECQLRRVAERHHPQVDNLAVNQAASQVSNLARVRVAAACQVAADLKDRVVVPAALAMVLVKLVALQVAAVLNHSHPLQVKPAVAVVRAARVVKAVALKPAAEIVKVTLTVIAVTAAVYRVV